MPSNLRQKVDKLKKGYFASKQGPRRLNAKEEVSEQDADDQDSDALREELQISRDEFPPHDSEDSLGPEHVENELRRLTAAHSQMMGTASTREPMEGATAPDSTWENHSPYAPQRSRNNRGRQLSPDPLMFHTTIWLEHDQEASARAHEEPIEQLRDRGCTMEANFGDTKDLSDPARRLTRCRPYVKATELWLQDSQR